MAFELCNYQVSKLKSENSRKFWKEVSIYINNVHIKNRILIFYPSRILDPGVKKRMDPGSGSTTLAVKL
jgi:hypothetical protein